ncbi:MAG: ribonuclease HII [Ferrovibrio sp.]|uniref:ribonuclease HII n=1 Tax=Ferrovibrio sp. TaxID=1917215 RepID=UPI002633B9E8|nr:ribonuclease HII [Ferrovibrio sp.]MCW0233592.1 ribonuclease HII [Ferrovibrio sp.]
MPDFALELKLAGPNGGLICGVDEAGRGPLAGPVVAAAVILDRRKRQRILWGGIDDSKKLTHDKRETLFLRLRQHALAGEARIGIGAASVAEIARLNIFHATMLAMCRAVTALRVVPMHALIDGNHCPKQLGCPATAVVDGDALSVSIAAASIVAKVVRDRAMAKLHQRYPAYGWASNKGYGTPEHQEGLRLAGISKHHRLGFAPVRSQMTLDLVLTN